MMSSPICKELAHDTTERYYIFQHTHNIQASDKRLWGIAQILKFVSDAEKNSSDAPV